MELKKILYDRIAPHGIQTAVVDERRGYNSICIKTK
jgi:hypothetical protein